MDLINNNEYSNWLSEIKSKIQSAQIKASLSINRELLNLYWEIGRSISEKVEVSKWGKLVVENLSEDLKKEFPGQTGFSRRNLFNMKKWYEFYSQSGEIGLVQQAVALIPWGHNIQIITKTKTIKEALFYTNQTIENNWSRSVLVHQIESGYYKRQGKAITNFSETLPAVQSDLAKETLKDPYKFDFLNLQGKVDEKTLEDGLTKHIISFLLELGKGFAFVGRQYLISTATKDYNVDLLFYHLKLRCYVVVELKAKEFKPEHAGKLNFYLSLVDNELKEKEDNSTIGLLLCKSKDKIEAEYSMQGMIKPMGISEYELGKTLPEEIKKELPSIEKIEAELSDDKKINPFSVGFSKSNEKDY